MGFVEREGIGVWVKFALKGDMIGLLQPKAFKVCFAKSGRETGCIILHV